MTRAEFLDDVTTWGELKDICNEYNCDVCDEIYDSEYRDEYINDMLMDWAREDSWQDLRDRLNELDDDGGYDWYIYDEYYGRYTGVDGDDDLFEDMKRRVLEYVDEYGDWDNEEEEDPEPYYEAGTQIDEDDIDPTPEEECGIGDMFGDGVACFRSINEASLEKAREENRFFMEIQSEDIVF